MGARFQPRDGRGDGLLIHRNSPEVWTSDQVASSGLLADCPFLFRPLNGLPSFVREEWACVQIGVSPWLLGHRSSSSWQLLPNHFVQVCLRAFHSVALHIYYHHLITDTSLHVGKCSQECGSARVKTCVLVRTVFDKLHGAGSDVVSVARPQV